MVKARCTVVPLALKSAISATRPLLLNIKENEGKNFHPFKNLILLRASKCVTCFLIKRCCNKLTLFRLRKALPCFQNLIHSFIHSFVDNYKQLFHVCYLKPFFPYYEEKYFAPACNWTDYLKIVSLTPRLWSKFLTFLSHFQLASRCWL